MQCPELGDKLEFLSTIYNCKWNNLLKSHLENSHLLYWKKCRPTCFSMTKWYFCKRFLLYHNTKGKNTWLTLSNYPVSQFVIFPSDILASLKSSCLILISLFKICLQVCSKLKLALTFIYIWN